MCHWDNFVYVMAEDDDAFPNSAPFEFKVIQEESQGNWVVEPLNGKFNGSGTFRAGRSAAGGDQCCSFPTPDTTIILRDQDELWPGVYSVVVEIKDQQGKACGDVQKMDVVVCTCDEDTKTCGPRKATSSNFSSAGILLLLLGLLLLLRESLTFPPSPARACCCRLLNSSDGWVTSSDRDCGSCLCRLGSQRVTATR